MEFNKSDFEKLKFRVDKIDLLNSDVLKLFPELPHFKEFYTPAIKELELDGTVKFAQVFAFICYVYDNNSPYAKKYADDIMKRKKVVADACFFPRNNSGEFKKSAENVITCRNAIFNAMVIRFLRILKNPHWSSLCTYMDALSLSELAMIDSTIESKEKRDHLGMTITLREEIQKLQETFLGDNNPNLEMALYNAIEDEEMCTPEYIGLKEFQKENPNFFNPYTNKLPIRTFMEKLKNGESVYEWDNREIILNKEERDRDKVRVEIDSEFGSDEDEDSNIDFSNIQFDIAPDVKPEF